MRSRPARLRSRIIYFHSVADREGSTTPERFREQVETALELGFEVVPLAEMLADGPDSTNRLSLTFDDGYADNVDEAVPIMSELGVTATIFVVSGAVAEQRRSSDSSHLLYPDRPMLSSSDLRELSGRGFTVGSHSHHHRLAAAEAANNPDSYADELAVSRARLESESGAPVRFFAYPNGQRGAFSRQTTALVEQAGFDAAFTTVWGDARHFRNRMTLPRCQMPERADRREVIARLSGRRDVRRLKNLAMRGSRKWGRELDQ